MNGVGGKPSSRKLKLTIGAFKTLGPVSIFENEGLLSDSDRKELKFWENDLGEGPGSDLFDNVIYKSRVMLTFRRALKFLNLSGDECVVELGSGQGWASVMLKREYPNCYVVASDVSPHALQMAEGYEKLIGASIDEKWASSASGLPFTDGQIDVVFCFAAFHHFIIGDRYAATLKEMLRILRPGGRIVLLFEPCSPRFLYGMATRRVNKNRAQVAAIDEDVLQLTRLSEESTKLGATFEYEHFPDYQDRLSIISSFYYLVLNKMPLLQPLLPCTINVRITKSLSS